MTGHPGAGVDRAWALAETLAAEVGPRRPASPKGGWEADARLLAAADRVSGEHPELEIARSRAPIGLTYDSTAVLARGGRALTVVAADDRGRIPNYHQPSDILANLDRGTLGRALGFGREMLALIDAGGAD